MYKYIQHTDLQHMLSTGVRHKIEYILSTNEQNVLHKLSMNLQHIQTVLSNRKEGWHGRHRANNYTLHFASCKLFCSCCYQKLCC